MLRWFEYVTYRFCVALFVGVAVVLAGALALASLIEPRPSWWSWGVVVALPLGMLLFTVLLATALLRPWRYARDVERMLAGGWWVHWTYDEAGWKEAKRTERQGYAKAVRSMGIVLAVSVVVLLIWLGGGRRSLDLAILGATGAVLALLMLTVIAVASPIRVVRGSKQGSVYIGRHGVYWQPGGYFSLDPSPGVELDSVDLVDGPCVHIVARTWSGSGGTGRWVSKTLADIAVPQGCEDEARKLVERLRTEVVNAAKPQSRLLRGPGRA
jgi:hypothetical protein